MATRFSTHQPSTEILTKLLSEHVRDADVLETTFFQALEAEDMNLAYCLACALAKVIGPDNCINYFNLLGSHRWATTPVEKRTDPYVCWQCVDGCCQKHIPDMFVILSD